MLPQYMYLILILNNLTPWPRHVSGKWRSQDPQSHILQLLGVAEDTDYRMQPTPMWLGWDIAFDGSGKQVFVGVMQHMSRKTATSAALGTPGTKSYPKVSLIPWVPSYRVVVPSESHENVTPYFSKIAILPMPYMCLHFCSSMNCNT